MDFLEENRIPNEKDEDLYTKPPKDEQEDAVAEKDIEKLIRTLMAVKKGGRYTVGGNTYVSHSLGIGSDDDVMEAIRMLRKSYL